MQSLFVAVLVVACFVYALWTLAPKRPRSQLAVALLKVPLLAALQKPLNAAARLQGGCGCNGCDRAASPAKTKPVIFMRKP
jgi:hypothetical protein